jgi:hypothetical protein
MSRTFAGWVLIAFGLAGIVGGAVMTYVFWVANDTAAQNARVQQSMSPGSMPTAPPRQSERILQYGAAGLSAFVGIVLLFWGAGMRGSGPLKRSGKNRWKRTCPNCGELSPKAATQCFHCGSPF